MTHELTLLRWEVQLQMELGQSINNLVNSLAFSVAAKVRSDPQFA